MISQAKSRVRRWLGTLVQAPARPSNSPQAPDLSPELRSKALDLQMLDGAYQVMFSFHRDVHERAYRDIGSTSKSVLEIACGTGFAYPLARVHDLNYLGVDISETAIAMCCLKYPDGLFLNAPIYGLGSLADRCFDAVYCSSMLEHIGKVEIAVQEMWRLAGRRLDLVFYEGLADSDEHLFRFVPYDTAEPRETWGGCYGMKVVLQDHGPRDGRSDGRPIPGYFMNKFAREPMRRLIGELPGVEGVEIRDLPHQRHGMRTWVTVLKRGLT
jgi:SAM-dependent methyltransferase